MGAMIPILIGKTQEYNMKRFALYIGLATALMASCSIQEEDVKTPPQDDVIFYASFEQPVEAGTRVYANEDLLLRWTADDRVSIFNKLTYNQEYRFTGQTGANAGGFKKVDNDEFVTGNTISHVVSVYPYQESTTISESEETSLMLPAVQHYAENTFGLGANTMVSVSEDNVLQYKNVGGYLMLKLYGEGVSVSSITLKGNNGEKLAGDATVTMPLNGVPTAVMADNGATEITLSCATPVQLGETPEESTQFWFVVPPVTFSKGFTITVREYTGEVIEKSTDKSITIGRNKLSKMSPLEMEGGTPAILIPEAVDLGLSIKWASFNLGASKPEEYGDYYAWGETEPYYSNLDPLTWKEGKEAGYAWASYFDTIYDGFSFTTYYWNGGKTILEAEHDAAYVTLGREWRLPTLSEWKELWQNCEVEWVTINGNCCKKVIGPSGNSILLPAAGYRRGVTFENSEPRGHYWSSFLHTWDEYAYSTSFVESSRSEGNTYRFYGLSVRPVYDANNTTSVSVEASAELIYDNGDCIRIDPIYYEGFHHKYLTDDDLEEIFVNLAKNASPDFTSAVLYLAVYDAISGRLFRNETYGVVYNTHTGHFDFASL